MSECDSKKVIVGGRVGAFSFRMHECHGNGWKLSMVYMFSSLLLSCSPDVKSSVFVFRLQNDESTSMYWLVQCVVILQSAQSGTASPSVASRKLGRAGIKRI